MNTAEQIRAYTLKRTQSVDRLKAIMALSEAEGRTLDEAEDAEYGSLQTELGAIDTHLKRLSDMEALDAGTAKAVVPSPVKPAVPMILQRKHSDKDEAFKGQFFVRKAIAAALSQMDSFQVPAWKIAEQRWGKDCPLLVDVLKHGIVTKTGVVGHGSGSGEEGAELVTADSRYMGDFIELLYSVTVYDRLPLRQVPALVTIKGQDGAATGFWVGESKSIPASAASFSTVNLSPLKVGAITVSSNELIRDSSPSAEMLLRDSLVNAAAQRIDSTFISNAAASSGVSPAGLLNSVTALGSNGQDGTAVREDLKELYAPFISAKIPTDGLYLVMHPNLALGIGLMTNALGQDEFPGVTPNGGTLRGLPVVTGHNVGATWIVMVKPSEIWRIGNDTVEISLSREATIEQDTAPAGASDTPTAASATLMSMFGTESTAFKIVRSINYQKRRTQAAQWISDALYGTFT
jgi:HK97 family phage major capsid protein